MKSQFKKEQVSYSSGEIITPYQRAQQEWDIRIGQSRLQARNWRILSTLSLLVAALLAVILMLALAKNHDHVYIAEVTKEGKVVNVTSLDTSYQPNEAQKEYFVAHFIELTRSIPLDPVLAKKNWLNAYDFLDSRGAELLNHYFRQSNPIALLGKKTITIQIADIHPISPTTYHVNWVENVTNNNGQEEAKNGFGGIFTITMRPPTKHEEILHNPLGICIIDFSITPKESKTK